MGWLGEITQLDNLLLELLAGFLLFHAPTSTMQSFDAISMLDCPVKVRNNPVAVIDPVEAIRHKLEDLGVVSVH